MSSDWGDAFARLGTGVGWREGSPLPKRMLVLGTDLQHLV